MRLHYTNDIMTCKKISDIKVRNTSYLKLLHMQILQVTKFLYLCDTKMTTFCSYYDLFSRHIKRVRIVKSQNVFHRNVIRLINAQLN